MKWWDTHINLPLDGTVKLPNPLSGHSQNQETSLETSADKQTCNYDIECSNHHPSLLTLKTKGLGRRKMKWWAIYTKFPADVTVRLPHPLSGNSQGKETYLAPSVDKQTRNYDIECSNHHPSLSTLRPKGLSRSKMKLWTIYVYLPVDVILRLPHPRIGYSQNQETFLAPSPDQPTRNDCIECSIHHPSLSTLRPKGLTRSKMKWWAIYTNIPVDVIVRLPHNQSGYSQSKETFWAPSADKETRNFDIEWSNHHPSLSILRPKGLSHSKMKWWAIHTNLPVDVIGRLPHRRSGDSRN